MAGVMCLFLLSVEWVQVEEKKLQRKSSKCGRSENIEEAVCLCGRVYLYRLV